MEAYVKTRQGKAAEMNKTNDTCLVVANSQAYAEGFYAKQGYVREGEKFLEDGGESSCADLGCTRRFAH